MPTTIDDLKAAARIEDIIAEDEPLQERNGRWRKGRSHDSLVVDVERQSYFWNQRGEHGDVFDWLKYRRGMEFKDALEYLARRYNLEIPGLDEAGKKTLQQRRQREEIFAVAARFFQDELARSVEATEYVRSRGWSMETAQACGLGYWSGNVARLLAHLSSAGVDIESPAAVALTGYRGELRRWGEAHGVVIRAEWLREMSIPGMPGHMLIYPHTKAGRVVYLTGRGIGEKRHYNLPLELAGEKQPYFNHVWTPAQPAVVLVEGQADAVTLGQWDVAAAGLCGAHLGDALVATLKRHKALYVGLDHDDAGNKNLPAIADALGPNARIIFWPAKDVNEWLKRDGTAQACAELLKKAPTWLDHSIQSTLARTGDERDESLRHAFRLIVNLDAFTYARRRREIMETLSLASDAFDSLLKLARREAGLDDSGKPPYEVIGNRTFARVYDTSGHDRQVVLAHFAAWIMTDVLEDNGEAQTRRFEVEGRLPGGRALPRVEVEAAEFAQMQWPLTAWGSRAIIAAGSATRDKLREAILMTSKQIEAQSVYAHTGWRRVDGRWVFLSSSGAVGMDHVRVRLNASLSRYKLPIVPRDVTAAMQASLRSWDAGDQAVTIPLWAAMYLAPLSTIVQPAFTIWLFGTTGSMKSTITALMMNHFGTFFYNTPPASWTGTAAALGFMAFTLKDMPLWIDDFTAQATLRGNEEMIKKADQLLRDWGNRAGRSRLQQSATDLRSTHNPRGLILSTAEQLPPIESIQARLFQIETSPGQILGGEGSALTQAQQADAPLYAHAMAAYVLWLESQLDRLEHEIPARLLALTERARSEGGAHLRLPANIATLYLGLEMGLKFARSTSAIGERDADGLMTLGWNVLIGLGSRQHEVAVEEKPVEMYLSALEQMFAQGIAYLRHKELPGSDERAWPGAAVRTLHAELLGWYDAQYWYLLPGVAYRAVYGFYKAAGIVFPDSERGVRAKLLEQKRIHPNGDRFTYRLRTDELGSHPRVLRLVPPGLENGGVSPEAGSTGSTGSTGSESEI